MHRHEEFWIDGSHGLGHRLLCLLILPTLLFLLTLLTSSGSLLAQEEAEQEWAFQADKAASSLLVDVSSAGQLAIAVGERGHVLVSTDGGRKWRQAEVPTRRMLCAVFVLDEEHVWVAGHDAIILFSSDGGLSWSRQYFAPEEEAPLFDIWFENPRHGIAIGAYGLFLETFDGGQTWQSRYLSEEDPHLFAITETPQHVLYIAGEFGTILRSSNLGQSWQSCSSPYEGTLFGALALQDESVLVFGLRGNLYRSSDTGQHWRRLTTGTNAALLGGTQLADGTVMIVGLSGCILTSDDGAESFRLASRPERTAMAVIHQLNRGSLVILGEDGLVKWDELSLE